MAMNGLMGAYGAPPTQTKGPTQGMARGPAATPAAAPPKPAYDRPAPTAVAGPRPTPAAPAWNPPPQWNPTPGRRPSRDPNQMGRGSPGGPPMSAPPAQWGGRAPHLNWQQNQMRSMPAAMRQMYNGRPVTQQPQGLQATAPPTQRGRPAASRVNLQGNQLNRFRY